MLAHRITRTLLLALLTVCLTAALASAQSKGKKSYIFHGKVTAVSEKGLTVNGEKVEGWMPAMTMNYGVDKPEVLKKVKVGDQIKATVYDGDEVLHDVEVVPPTPKK